MSAEISIERIWAIRIAMIEKYVNIIQQSPQTIWDEDFIKFVTKTPEEHAMVTEMFSEIGSSMGVMVRAMKMQAQAELEELKGEKPGSMGLKLVDPTPPLDGFIP